VNSYYENWILFDKRAKSERNGFRTLKKEEIGFNIADPNGEWKIIWVNITWELAGCHKEELNKNGR